MRKESGLSDPSPLDININCLSLPRLNDMRKSHTKSRFGCKQCKARKVKCDEKKPACSRCLATERHCTYLRTVVVSAPSSVTHSSDLTPSGASPVPPTPELSQWHDALSRASVFGNSSPPGGGGGGGGGSGGSGTPQDPAFSTERYSLIHLDLIQYLNTGFLSTQHLLEPQAGPMLEATFKEASRAPYVMDGLLALVAAHKSTIVDDVSLQQRYLHEATKLQTRALSQINLANGEVTDDNALPLFCFSAYLVQQAVFDVFVSPLTATSDLSQMLDRLIQCLHLHCGIGIIAQKSWEMLREVLFPERAMIGPGYKKTHEILEVSESVGGECQRIYQLLHESRLDDKTREVYEDAVKLLQHLLDRVRAEHNQRAAALHEWLVRVPPEYSKLLRERRPEALVVLAHFAVLLNSAKDYWAIGEYSGVFLIRSISSHLGDFWADWLAWPMEAIRNT